MLQTLHIMAVMEILCSYL